MADETHPNSASYAAATAKREWVAPRLEVAEGRHASATFAPGGSVDYGFYS
jgi:hypothetical protein